MLFSNIKKQLIDKIQETNDDNLLEEVYRILETGTLNIEQIVLSHSQKKRIDQGIDDIENGKYLSEDDANREIKEWLKK